MGVNKNRGVVMLMYGIERISRFRHPCMYHAAAENCDAEYPFCAGYRYSFTSAYLKKDTGDSRFPACFPKRCCGNLSLPASCFNFLKGVQFLKGAMQFHWTPYKWAYMFYSVTKSGHMWWTVLCSLFCGVWLCMCLQTLIPACACSFPNLWCVFVVMIVYLGS